MIKSYTRYCEEIAGEICERIAMGETLSSVCQEDRMPDKRTVWKWRKVHPKFAQDYSRARVDQMNAWADQIIHLADDAEGDFMVSIPLDSPELEKIERDGVVTFKFNRKHVNRAKLMIDVRKWLMARYAPEDFGDRSAVSLAVSYDEKSDDELLEDFREAAKKAGMTSDMIIQLLKPVE